MKQGKYKYKNKGLKIIQEKSFLQALSHRNKDFSNYKQMRDMMMS